MTPQARWPRRWCGLALALTLLGPCGCLSFCHPIKPEKPDYNALCRSFPEPCRNHVYVFLIHGLDPLDFANLSGVRDYVQALGFTKTYYGQMYHVFHFIKELRRIHQEDPEAHFVLIGFSFGANLVRNLANAVKNDGVIIDLLVYLGGNTLENCPRDHPEHVVQLVNILATGCIWNGTTFDNAENLNYSNVWHFGSPTHPQTLEVLARELAVVAGRTVYTVPAVPPAPPGILAAYYPPAGDVILASPEDLAPAPAAAPPTAPPSRGDWDFLKPAPALDENLPELPAPRKLKKQ